MPVHPLARKIPGSFRDKNNQVFDDGLTIVRGVSAEAVENWRALSLEPFFQEFTEKGYVVKTELAEAGIEDWPAALRHRRVEMISYPYEWTFGMLKSAALFHLYLFARSIENGWTLKDASAYNVQWNGTKPLFIDTPSFQRYEEGAPWAAYRQFCMMFLYPLMFAAYRGIDFRPFLRSSLDGIAPTVAQRILGTSAAFKPGVLSHVILHSRLERRAESRDAAEAKALTETSGKAVKKLRSTRHSKDMVLGTIDSVARLVRNLELTEVRTSWGNYTQEHSYSDSSLNAKRAFVERHCAASYRRTVWDIGCNTGTFARLAALHADLVVAIDGDGLAIERLYRALKAEEHTRILPLVIDLTNPSPNQGWMGVERTSLERRGKPDLVLCLALVHHLVLTANIPLGMVMQWLRSLDCEVIFEYVDTADPMSQMLIRNKIGQHHELTKEEFFRCIASSFDVADSQELKGGLRTIYFLRPL